MRRIMRWFSKQPVGVRVALITAALTVPTLLGVERYRAYLDRQARDEERTIQRRAELTTQLTPQLRLVGDLTVSVATTLRIGEEPDSTSRDSLQVLAEDLMVSMGGTGSQIAQAYGDSMGIRYGQMVLAFDSLFHTVAVLWGADRGRTAPDAMDALRNDILQRALRAGRQSTSLLNDITAGHALTR